MRPNYEASLEFLRWWKPQGPWVLTAIEPDKKGIETRTFTEASEAHIWLERMGTTRNVYFHVNPCMTPMVKKASAKDIARMEWLQVDIDPRVGEDLDKERERAISLLRNPPDGIPVPSAIVFSGGGYQGFWRLSDGMDINGEESLYEKAKRYNLQLEIQFGADSCHNVDRIMRLPGTINRPDARKRKKGRKAALAYTVALTDHVYSLDQFTPAPEVQTDGGWVQRSQRVRIQDNIERLASVDDLPEKVRDSVRVLIVQGHDPDEPNRWPSRSECLLYVCCELVRAEVSDDVIYSIITDPEFGISESVREKGSNAQKYAVRQIERAHDLAIDEELYELNERYAVIGSIGGKCRVIFEEDDLSLGRRRIVRQSFEDFRNRYMHRKKVVGRSRDGTEICKPLGHWWLSHENRRQFDTMVFAPGREVSNAYNLWQGFGCEARPGDCGLFLQHVKDNLCQGDETLYAWLIGWCGRAVQHPELPGYTAIVLRGGQGTGKSFFAKTLGHLFGRHYMQVSNPAHLVGQFNNHLRDCVLLFGDEAFFAGDKRHEGALKTLVTEDLLMVEAKGVDADIMPNCVHLVLASNENWVVPANMDDRRFLVLDVGRSKQRDVGYFKAIADQLENGGYEALLHYLLTLHLDDFDYRNPPKTAALQQQKLYSLDPEHEWWLNKLRDGRVLPQHGDWEGMVLNYDLQNDFVAYTNRFTRNFRGSATKLGQFLGRVLPGGVRKKQLGGVVDTRSMDGSIIQVHRPTFYVLPSLDQCRRHWETIFGEFDWDDPEQDPNKPQSDEELI